MADDEEEETPTKQGEGLDFLKGAELAEQPKFMTTAYYIATGGFLILYLYGGWQAGNIHWRDPNSFFDGGAYSLLLGLILLGSGAGFVFGNKSHYAKIGQFYFAGSFLATIFLEGTGLMEIMILFIGGGIAIKAGVHMLKPQMSAYTDAIRSSRTFDEAKWKMSKERNIDDYNTALGRQKKAINSIEENLTLLKSALSVKFDLGAVESEGWRAQHSTMSTILTMGPNSTPAVDYRYDDTISEKQLERLAYPNAVAAANSILLKVKEGVEETKGTPKELGSWILDSWPLIVRCTNELFNAAIVLRWEELKVKQKKLPFNRKTSGAQNQLMERYKRYEKGESALKIILNILENINSLSKSFSTQAKILLFDGAAIDFSDVRMYRVGIDGTTPSAPGSYTTQNYISNRTHAGNHIVSGNALALTDSLGTTLGEVIENMSKQLKTYHTALKDHTAVKKHLKTSVNGWPKELIKETWAVGTNRVTAVQAYKENRINTTTTLADEIHVYY